MKMNATLTHIKVPLSQLKITTNVRQDFDEAEIAELAQSIRDNGLINAVTVKPPVIDEHGDKTYEVIAGGRRIRAHQWLCEHGDDFSMIDCKISTGDMWTIQMVENIQRTDLSPREKEAAIIRAIESGMSQKEIAEKLSKPLSYISDVMAGIKVRQAADKAGINTDSISSKALAQFRSFDEKELPEKLRELVESGGRVSDATNILKASRTTLESSKNEDESMIEPTELSEKDFHDDVDFEKDRKESRFVVGTEIDIAGERLFFKNLWHGRYVVLKINGKNIVCFVSSSLNADTVSFFYRETEDFSKDKTVKLSVSEIDSEIENEQYNIYAIPDNAKAIRKPSLSKKNDSDLEEKTKQKGFANPVSKEIQKRWVVFCRDKKIPESEKTAFKFYQELTTYFENTRKG